MKLAWGNDPGVVPPNDTNNYIKNGTNNYTKNDAKNVSKMLPTITPNIPQKRKARLQHPRQAGVLSAALFILWGYLVSFLVKFSVYFLVSFLV